MTDVTWLYRRLLADLAASNGERSLRDPLRQARADGLSEEDLAELEKAVTDAETVRRRLRELGEHRRAAEARASGCERSDRAQDELVGVVLRGGGPTEFAEVAAEHLRAAVALRDTDGRVLARSGELGVLPPLLPADHGAPSGVRARRGRHPGGSEYWAAPVVAGEEPLGELLLVPQEAPPAAWLRTVEAAAAVMGLLLLVRRGVAATEDQLRAELLTDLLLGSETDLLTVHERGRELGFDLDAAHCVALAAVDAPRQRLAQALSHHAGLLGALGVVHRGHAVLLLPGHDPSALAQRCRRALTEALRREVTVGAAGPVQGPGQVQGAYQEALRCLHALYALGRRGSAASRCELGFVGLLLADRAEPAGFVRSALGPVLDYDARRGTELVRTLRAYFAAGRSAAHAKDELNVHVNTVVQRLERLRALLGSDWHRPERLLQLELALLLLDVVPEEG